MTIYTNIALARLYERTSKRGNTYLSGKLGLANVAIVKSDETSESGQAIWYLKISEPPPKADVRDINKPLNQDVKAAEIRSFERDPLSDDVPF